MLNKIVCFIFGHQRVTRKRLKDIKYALKMYGWDAWGQSAFDNIKRMEELRLEAVRCPRCGKKLK